MSLFTLLLIVIGVVAVIGVLSGMDTNARSAVIKAPITASKATMVYVTSQVRSVVRTTYDTSRGVGAEINAEYREHIVTLDKWSNNLEARGVVKVAAETAKEHRKLIGLDEAEKAAAEYRRSREDKAAKAAAQF